MAKVDLGEKRVCPECEAKFYDLTKNPATCPMCQFSYDPLLIALPGPKPPKPSLLKTRKTKKRSMRKMKRPKNWNLTVTMSQS